jgi:hypothetical protein
MGVCQGVQHDGMRVQHDGDDVRHDLRVAQLEEHCHRTTCLAHEGVHGWGHGAVSRTA